MKKNIKLVDILKGEIPEWTIKGIGEEPFIR